MTAHPERPPEGPPAATPVADVRARRALPLIWLVPIIAAVIALYLGWRTLAEEGPTITISWRAADGLTAGQTRVKHKAVDLGTVERIALSRDMSHVEVHIRMRKEAEQVLTDHAKFWVVRPRLTPGNISGLETIVSGSFIELDPGLPGGNRTDTFTGLEEPPPVRSDEPGRTFTLRAGRLGSLSTGSLVIYRDVAVGEVLGYDQVQPGQPIRIHAFIRAPYDDYVHDGSFFWNSSGLSITAGSEGIHLQLESIQAVLAGAVAFDTSRDAVDTPVSKDGAEFRLFPDEAAGTSSHFEQRLAFLAHFKSAVSGLTAGSKVTMYGIQVGTVTSVALNFDPKSAEVDVPVAFEVQPQRFMAGPLPPPQDVMSSVQALVKAGMRAQLHTDNILTGQQSIALDFFPQSSPVEVVLQGKDIVLPSQPSEFDSITETITALAGKLQHLPLDEIANNLNASLAGVARIANGQELRGALQSLSTTMTDVQGLVQRLDAGLTPALKRLPDIAAQLQGASEKVNHLAGSVDTGYGGNSEFSRNLARLLVQVNETARSVRLLADFLDQHPEALIRGRTGSATER